MSGGQLTGTSHVDQLVDDAGTAYMAPGALLNQASTGEHLDIFSLFQHHIVNSLGWRDLRPIQERVIPAALAGEHLIVLAPTAGGKTEAAFFPLLSRMQSEGWTGL